MTRFATIPAMIALSLGLAGCTSGLSPYAMGENTGIAIAFDTGRDQGALIEGEAAIAYDPDGCQGWIIDDGIEGYSGRRYDPRSGLPICNGHFPPGTVLTGYQTGSAGLSDWVPGHAGN
jgi:hypothetical protein